MVKKKIQQKIAFTFLFLIIIAMIMAPIAYFKIVDKYYYEGCHPMKTISFTLSSDVKDVAMVQRLHNLLNSYYADKEVFLLEETIVSEAVTMKIYNSQVDVQLEEEEADIIKELQKIAILDKLLISMEQFQSKDSNAEKQTKEKKTLKEESSIVIMNEQEQEENNLQKQEEPLVVYKYCVENNSLTLYYDRESKKVIKLEYEDAKMEELSEDEIRTLEENYITYMNLDIVDDWYYNGENMVSEKAHLCLNIMQEKGRLVLEFKVVE